MIPAPRWMGEACLGVGGVMLTRQVDVGQEVDHQLIEVVWALERHHV
jgi:hypothetical protein